MADHLKSLPIEQVEQWYRRLAKLVGTNAINGKTPLASVFLTHYLDNRLADSTFVFTAPKHLQTSAHVYDGLKYHRDVFLSNEKARIGKNKKWAGVQPRIHGCGRKVWNPSSPIKIEYHSLVEIGNSMSEIIRIQARGSMGERDLFTSLRGFQLHSEVTVKGTKQSNSVLIEFISWKSKISDYYDFNFNEHLTLPNPDYKSTAKNAVRPKDRQLVVYHSNAKRLEDAKLAAPYKIESNWWAVVKREIVASAKISKEWSCSKMNSKSLLDVFY